MRDCEIERFQASGPGGQKRNRVYSAIRLRHRPTGLGAQSSEYREADRNRRDALHKLRLEMAFAAFPSAMDGAGETPLPRLRYPCNPGHADFPLLVFTALSLFEACRGEAGEAARRAGLSTSAFTKFLRLHKKMWSIAGRIRAASGLPPLH